MIWLRHELWEYTDGLGYRLASRSDTDDTGAPLRGGTLKQIFYAPSPAAAKAQYWALRQLGPIIPSRFESDAPFTLAQLQAQLAQYPDDATLHGQPALHPAEEADAAVAAAPAALEGEPLESLEPWPVVAHSEPDPAEAPDAVVAEAEPVAVGDEAPEPPSNVVPIRPDVTPAALRPESTDTPPSEPQSAEAVALERPRVAASGAMALALAELGPAAAASGALALALAELEPTPHTRPDDGDTGAGGGHAGGAPLAVVASHSPSTLDEPSTAAPHAVETADVTETVHTPAPVEPIAAEPSVVEPVAVEPAAEGPVVIEPIAVEPLAATAEVAEPLLPEPVAAEKAVEADPLGPITTVATTKARGKRRKSGFFAGLLRIVMLLIILGAVIVGVGIATGTWDGPTLLAQARALPEQARALPDQIRNLSIVKTLLPG